jgi:hypothetical protein
MHFPEEPVTPVYRHWMCEQVGCNGEMLSTGEGITRLTTRWKHRARSPRSVTRISARRFLSGGSVKVRYCEKTCARRTFAGIALGLNELFNCDAGCRRYCHACRIDSNTEAQRTNNEVQNGNWRRIEPATSHRPCSASRSRAHVRVFARNRAAVDAAAACGLRTRRDAALQPICPGRSTCQRLHVSLPPLP